MQGKVRERRREKEGGRGRRGRESERKIETER